MITSAEALAMAAPAAAPAARLIAKTRFVGWRRSASSLRNF